MVRQTALNSRSRSASGPQRCSRSSSAVKVPMRIKLAVSKALFGMSTPIHSDSANHPTATLMNCSTFVLISYPMDRDLQLNTTRIRRDRWPPSIGMHGRVQSESLAGGFWILRTGRTGMGWTATLDGIKRAKRGSDEVATGADLMTGEQS